MHKTGCFARALYARGRGPHYAEIITEKASKRHFIKLPENVKTTSGLLMLMHDIISLPDTSYDKLHDKSSREWSPNKPICCC